MGATDSGSGCQSGSVGGSLRRTIQSRSPSETLRLLRKNTYRPVTRCPCSTTATSRSDHFSVSYRPRSQTNIRPPPYSPFGMSPSNVAYSIGWSSVCTASRMSPGTTGNPLGTAHETSTPPRSSRTSQCSRLAWCSWMTNVSSLPPGGWLSVDGTGSGVRAASRLRRYSDNPLTVPVCPDYPGSSCRFVPPPTTPWWTPWT
jgi:hypothetical protein